MFAKSYYLHWIAGRANILSKYIKQIFFNFGCGFYGSFTMLFPKAGTSCCKKKFGLIFAALYFYIYELKKCVSDFKILFQNGDINIFVLRGVFVSIYVQLKSISGEIRGTLQQRSYRKLTWQSIKGKFHQWQRLELFKVIHSAKLR